MNHAELRACLTNDPDMRYTPAGLAILDLPLGGTDHVTGSDNRTRELAWYHRLAIFGAFAEALADQLHQGDAIYATARLNHKTWEGQDGNRRSSLDLVADQVRTLGPATDVDTDKRGQPRLRNALNRVLVSGNATRDAELRHTNSGDAVLNLAVAVNERYKDQERTHFVDITAWRNLAEANSGIHKGEGIIAVGRLITDSWEDRNGNRRFTDKIEATELYPVVKRGQAPQRTAQAPARDEAALDIDDGSLPF